MGTKWERWVPAAGILFVVAFVVSYFVAGEPPKADDGAGAIRDYYADDGAILTSAYVFGIALVLFLSFVGTLASRLRDGGQRRLAAVAFGGGIATGASALIGLVVTAALAYRTPADDGVLQALSDVRLLADVLIAFPIAVLVGAAALAAQQAAVFPTWFNALAGLAAIVVLVSGGTFDSSGFFAPGGALALIATVAFLAWAAVSSALLTMEAQPAEAPQAAPAM